MKITIDTKEDSATDIRKVIALLSKLIEDSSEHHSNIFEDPSPGLQSSGSEPDSGNAFANMFGDAPTIAEEKKEPIEEEKDDLPEIIEY